MSLTRLEFQTTSDCIDLLDKLAEKDGVSRSEILRRSIGLYAWAAEEAENGRFLTPTLSEEIK
jgi:predicted transcriptional regulator